MGKARRGNGEGSVYYDDVRKRWEAAFVDPTGKRIKKRFKTKADANEWLTVMRSEIYQQTYTAPSNITLGEWLVEYLKTYCLPNIRPKTAATYKNTLHHLDPLADIPLQQLTAHGIQKFYNELPPLSGSTKVKIHAMLNRAVTKAWALGMIRRNPMLNVKRPKDDTLDIQIFTVEEIQKITEAFKVSKYWKKYQLFFLLAISTGMRLGEILGLRIGSVGNNYIKVENCVVEVNSRLIDMPPKTSTGIRKITISEDLAAKLKASYQSGKVMQINGYVFHTANNTPYRPCNIRRMWIGILKEAGLPYRNFHCLRHTHATQLLAAGVPLLEVSKRLGHAKTSYTVNIYGHAIPGYDEQIPEQVDKIFFSAGGSMGAIK